MSRTIIHRTARPAEHPVRSSTPSSGTTPAVADEQPAMVKIDAENKLVVRRETIES